MPEFSDLDLLGATKGLTQKVIANNEVMKALLAGRFANPNMAPQNITEVPKNVLPGETTVGKNKGYDGFHLDNTNTQDLSIKQPFTWGTDLDKFSSAGHAAGATGNTLFDIAKGIGYDAPKSILDEGPVRPSEMSINPGEKGLNMAMALSPGAFTVEKNAVGVAGGDPPKITALMAALKGNKAYEARADELFNQYKVERANSVVPAASTANDLAKGTPEADKLLALQKTVSPEHLGQMAEQQAAWEIYNKALRKDDFKLGAFGAKPNSLRQLNFKEIEEMNNLLKKHPDKRDTILESYGLSSPEAAGPTISPTTAAERAFGQGYIKPTEVKSGLPDTVPTFEKPHNYQARILDDEMLADAKHMIKNGSSLKSVAAELEVHPKTLSKRINQGYSDLSQEEMLKKRPNTSVLNDAQIKQEILERVKSGESHDSVAKAIQEKLPGHTITRNMITNQVAIMRRQSKFYSSGNPLVTTTDILDQLNPNKQNVSSY